MSFEKSDIIQLIDSVLDSIKLTPEERAEFQQELLVNINSAKDLENFLFKIRDIKHRHAVNRTPTAEDDEALLEDINTYTVVSVEPVVEPTEPIVEPVVEHVATVVPVVPIVPIETSDLKYFSVEINIPENTIVEQVVSSEPEISQVDQTILVEPAVESVVEPAVEPEVDRYATFSVSEDLLKSYEKQIEDLIKENEELNKRVNIANQNTEILCLSQKLILDFTDLNKENLKKIIALQIQLEDRDKEISLLKERIASIELNNTIELDNTRRIEEINRLLTKSVSDLEERIVENNEILPLSQKRIVNLNDLNTAVDTVNTVVDTVNVVNVVDTTDTTDTTENNTNHFLKCGFINVDNLKSFSANKDRFKKFEMLVISRVNMSGFQLEDFSTIKVVHMCDISFEILGNDILSKFSNVESIYFYNCKIINLSALNAKFIHILNCKIQNISDLPNCEFMEIRNVDSITDYSFINKIKTVTLEYIGHDNSDVLSFEILHNMNKCHSIKYKFVNGVLDNTIN